jgi:hypothetical protein
MDSNNPFERIFYLEKAVLMLEPEELETLNIDLNEVRGLSSVAHSLLSAGKRRITREYTEYEVVSIPWAFNETEENFDRFIRPWYRNTEYWAMFITKHRKWRTQIVHKERYYNEFDEWVTCNYILLDIPYTSDKKELAKAIEKWLYKDCPRCGERIYKSDLEIEEYSVLNSDPFWSFFFEASKYLTVTGYEKMKAAFVSYANNFVFKVVRKLRDTLLKDVNLLAPEEPNQDLEQEARASS